MLKVKYTYILGLLGVIILVSSCDQVGQKEISDEMSTEQMSMNDLIGKTIEYRYGNDIYHVTIDSDTDMHWEAIAGGEKGVKEEEIYKAEFIDENRLFITWGEANGIGVSQILDFKNGIVHNHLLRGRDISIGRGKIDVLD